MCAIVGFAGSPPRGKWTETYEIVQAMIVSAEHRGRDATGFVARTEPLRRPRHVDIVTAKEPINASQFVERNIAWRRLQHKRSTIVVAHCRAATHGSPQDERNNHPHVSDDQELYLVHNGVLTNVDELADEHALELKSDCDSEVLLRLIESARHPFLGLEQCVKEAQGSFAVALLDRREGLTWLCRNRGRPLWLARVRRDRWFYASTPAILLTGLRSVLGIGATQQLDYLAPVPEDTPLAVSSNGLVIAPLT